MIAISGRFGWWVAVLTILVTGSAGAIYQFCGRPAYAKESFWGPDLSWCGTRLSADVCAFGMTRRRGVAPEDDAALRVLAESWTPVSTIVGKTFRSYCSFQCSNGTDGE